MTEVADLSFRVDTAGIKKGIRGLEDLGRAGAKVERRWIQGHECRT